MFNSINKAEAFPTCVEFQLSTACNAKCGCCPYDVVHAGQKVRRMSDALLDQIIRELAARRQAIKLVVPYFNNEPFADSRFIGVLRRLKAEVRRPIEVSTNLSLVNSEIADTIMSESLISHLRISMFGYGKQAFERRMSGLRWERFVRNFEYLSKHFHPESSQVVEVVMIAVPDLTEQEVDLARAFVEENGAHLKIFGYLDRAGSNIVRNPLPRALRTSTLKGCELNRPFERMVVDVGGNCVICSQDWKAETILGSIVESSLYEVWNSGDYKNLREFVCGATQAPANLICRSCKLALT